jgi:hypothetical protein
MLISPQSLIDGAMRTLREAVLPDVPSRFARGQLYCVLDVLNNLRDRIEEKAQPFVEESESANAALERVISALVAGGREGETSPLREMRSNAATLAPAERASMLCAALVRAVEILDGVPEAELPDAREALRGHFVTQALRDVVPLKPSLLSEISKG